jgi:hypothetical protein
LAQYLRSKLDSQAPPFAEARLPKQALACNASSEGGRSDVNPERSEVGCGAAGNQILLHQP